MYTSFVVWAEIAGGVCVNPVFGVALDGLLASAIRKNAHYDHLVNWFTEHTPTVQRSDIYADKKNVRGEVLSELSQRYFAENISHFINEENNITIKGLWRPSLADSGLSLEHPFVVPLPLGVCDVSENNSHNENKESSGGHDFLSNFTTEGWHWSCSNSELFTESGDIIWGEKFTDNIYYNYHTTRLKENIMFTTNVSVNRNVGGIKGRFRARQEPVMVVNANIVAWSVYGNPEIVFALLSTIDHVGDNHTRGEGAVLSWNVDFGDKFSCPTPNLSSSEIIAQHYHSAPSMNNAISVNACEKCYYNTQKGTLPITETSICEHCVHRPGRPLPEMCLVFNGMIQSHMACEHGEGFRKINGRITPPYFHNSEKKELFYLPKF